MPIDCTKLPDKEWLTLFEATAYIALGEALSQDDLRWSDYPSARIYYPEISSIWERCREEAGAAQGGCPELLKMIESFSRDPFHPPPSAVLRHSARRPPSSRSLYKLLRRLEQAQERDEKELVKAEPLVLRALLSRDVVFTGVRDGTREEICVFRCDGPPQIDIPRGAVIGLYAGNVEAFSAQPISSYNEVPMYFGKGIEWTDVNIEQASLVAWLNGTNNTAAEGAPPAREKRRQGRTPRHTPECEAAARRITTEKKASNKPSDKTDTAVIEAFQTWWEIEYPDRPAPVRETVRTWLTKWGL